MSTTVCTLFEGGYAVGAAALLNSLHRSGFKGTVICGLRGQEPSWAVDASMLEPMTVRFVQVERPEHLTYVKPWFMLTLLDEDRTIDRIVYLDPDVIVKCDWDVVEAWMDDGVAAVQDVNGILPSRHPLRLRWRKFLRAEGLTPVRERDVYVNAGFLGLARRDAQLLRTWWQIVQQSAAVVDGLTSLKNAGPNELFHSADQDALNMALEVFPCELNWAGREGMDFEHGGTLLAHAVGRPKPWEGKAFRRALQGFPPTIAQRAFMSNVHGPLPALGRMRSKALQGDLLVASAIARVWRRSS